MAFCYLFCSRIGVRIMITANAFFRHSPLLRRLPGVLSQVMAGRGPVTLAASLSSGVAKPLGIWQRQSDNRRSDLLLGKKVTAVALRETSTQISETPPSFARHYYWERVWAVSMLPLFPAALFIHNPVIDYLLATTVALHVHWGMEAVVEDYARPFVIGETLAKLSHYAIYAFSLLMYVGLLHFNYSDVGITKAFEMIWSL